MRRSATPALARHDRTSITLQLAPERRGTRGRGRRGASAACAPSAVEAADSADIALEVHRVVAALALDDDLMRENAGNTPHTHAQERMMNEHQREEEWLRAAAVVIS